MISPRLLAPTLLALALSACTATAPVQHNLLATWVPSPSQNARTPVIIVIHHTEQKSVQQSLRTLRTAGNGGPVSRAGHQHRCDGGIPCAGGHA
ncbi:hypothetical protein [Streptomyces sp. NPDC056468]|uniref:hypothetical protein n=1 Tax=Streptomyces sp. NPDC056468 TaxID=3345830 RepID=UPI00368BD7B5